MPLKSFKCSICGVRCPRKYLTHSKFKNRMSWLRRHRKKKHPKAHRKSTRKTLRTKRKKGLLDSKLGKHLL